MDIPSYYALGLFYELIQERVHGLMKKKPMLLMKNLQMLFCASIYVSQERLVLLCLSMNFVSYIRALKSIPERMGLHGKDRIQLNRQ